MNYSVNTEITNKSLSLLKNSCSAMMVVNLEMLNQREEIHILV